MENVNNYKNVGVFLDVDNIAINSNETLHHALDFSKLRNYVAKKYGVIRFCFAYFEGVPIPPSERFNNIILPRKNNYSLLHYLESPNNDFFEKVNKAGWVLQGSGITTSDLIIINDLKKYKQILDFTVVITNDRYIHKFVRDHYDNYEILTQDDLINTIFLTDDPTMKLIMQCINAKEKDIAAILLGTRLEKSIDDLAEINGLLCKRDPLAKVTETLYQSRIIQEQEYQKITRFRKIRNSSIHGNYEEYSFDDILEFSDWFLNWDKQT